MVLRTLNLVLAEIRLARRRESLFCTLWIVALTAELAFLAPLLRGRKPQEMTRSPDADRCLSARSCDQIRSCARAGADRRDERIGRIEVMRPLMRSVSAGITVAAAVKRAVSPRADSRRRLPVGPVGLPRSSQWHSDEQRVRSRALNSGRARR